MPTESARYRAKNDVCLHGLWRSAGDEFAYGGWPDADLDPLNDVARRIFSYWRQHRHQGLPHSPYVDGALVLPLTDQQLPRYVALKDMFFGGVQYQGHVFDAVGWPPNEHVRPVNAAAKAVFSYWSQHRSGPLPYPAWDREKQRVNLPAEQPVAACPA